MNILLVERINDANEYIELLAEAYEANGHTVVLDVQNFLFSSYVPDVVHLHWPEAIYRWRHRLPLDETTITLIEDRLRWYRERGAVIVYTAHNLLPHSAESADFARQIYSRMLTHVDIVLHHGTASIPLLKTELPECAGADHIVAPHGPYKARALEIGASRTFYGLPPSAWVLLNFGRQRENKGPDFTQEAFTRFNEPGSHLFTIGPRRAGAATTPGYLERIARRFARPATNTTTIWRSVPHDEIARIMAATDVVFLGHQEGLNSGLIALAASYAKPVVYPNLGNFREQLAGWNWGEEYEVGNVDSAAAALRRLRERWPRQSDAASTFDNRAWLDAQAWQKHVEVVENAIAARRNATS